VIAGVGVPVALTVKLNERPDRPKANVPLVKVGARPIDNVNVCRAVPEVLVAVNVSLYVPVLTGVPDSRAVPLLPAMKVTPEGSVPERVMVAAG
jgi:hypothetical protein